MAPEHRDHLPVGVESYGAYALGVWLTPGVPETARRFAKRSAIGALALGMLGQVVYHLLAADHAHRAPWPVVVLVSCLPVITLGFGASLTHLLRPAAPDQDAGREPGLSELNPGDETSTSPAGQQQERFGLTRAQATKVRQSVATEGNGHPSE